MGQEAIDQIRADWISMATHRASSKWQQLEGIIINLLQSGYLECEIRTIIPVGGTKINWLCNVLTNDINTLHTRHPLHIPAHAIHNNDLDAIKADVETREVKDGFPCTHCRPKQYLLDATLTFTKLHQCYKAKIEASIDGAYIVSYSKWIQYMHLFYPGLCLARLAENICNYCVQIDIQLKRNDLPLDERDRLLMEKETHLDTAIG